MFCKIICLCMCFCLWVPKVLAIGTSAVSAVLIETSANRVIYQKNAHKKMPMASTTKIMTAICAIEAGNIDRFVKVDDRAVGIEGSSIYLQKGEKLTMRELLYGLMLNSGNDAAMAIACEVSGSPEQFAALMNQTAKKIGANNTHFENPSGLDGKQHYTTAYDLALITSYALKIPVFAEIVSSYTKTIPNGDKTYDRQLKNHNKLLNLYEGCTGVKTGFTKKSGRCLVSSAKRDGTELVAVTLNDGDDWNDHIKMLDFGFDNLSNKIIIKKGSYIATISVQNGTNQYVKLYAQNDVGITVKKSEKYNVKTEYDIQSFAKAPISYGSCFGMVNVYVNDKFVARVNAVTREIVAEKQSKNMFKVFCNMLDLWLGMVYNN